MPKQCPYCNVTLQLSLFKDFNTYKRATYCSKKCYIAMHKISYEEVLCPECNKYFNRNANVARKKLFCSITCRYANDKRKTTGNEYITTQGYVAIKAHGHPMAYADGYILKHRFIMAEKLGRILSKDEQVHHKDGNKLNNKPDNLELLTNSEHQELHDSHKRLNTTEAVEKRTNTRWYT